VASVRAEPGSFRDPLSRVFVSDDEVLRAFTPQGWAEHEAVADSTFFTELTAAGDVVGTHPADASVLASLPGDWAGVVRHDRIDPITYPYEWTFEMLRDAALLQLDVTRRAISEGFITKDATPFNVQFEGTRPVFIDVGSFERLEPGSPWPGYRQLCEQFLNPLVLQAIGGLPFQPRLRGSLRGIPPSEVAPLIRGRSRFDRRLLVHVVLHARAEQKHAADDPKAMTDELRRAGFGPAVLDAQLRNLERTIRSLRWKRSDSAWSGYGDRAHYSDADLSAKEAVVESTVRDLGPDLVLDLGANDGRFSQVAVAAGAKGAVAVDSDAVVVDLLYRDLRAAGEQRILPLVVDLADPPPAQGWRHAERRSFTERMRPDLVLALAVVHHLALTDTVPFEGIVDFLADFGAPLVVELPHRDDPMVQLLLARKRDGLFDHYDTERWEAALDTRFVVDEKVELPSGRRTLYRCHPR
jgi:hypothetical protein